ncbi:hypothetical protein [Eleftheria terrae]|uniref:hypothetical protein n=1 Tax=Eleftheria terrae TaxID=1597781 RepID=UPI00263BB804|nr:hypothetical protein [Eleftheria terrae]WKB50773.1 hypothetical protein N7L95_13195 [Eleftheria terrae]
MAYQTGTAAGPTPLLDALRLFAVASGWQELRWGPSGPSQQLSLRKGELIFHLRSALDEALRSGYQRVTGIFLVGSDQFDPAQPWNNQPGLPRDPSKRIEAVGLYEVEGPCTYHLFSSESPVQLTMVAEVAPGVYHHLAFGQLVKYGDYPGGAFVSGAFGSSDALTASASDYIFGDTQDLHFGLPFNDYKYAGGNYVRAAADGFDGWWSVCQASPITGKRAISIWEEGPRSPRETLANYWWSRTPNTLNGIAPLLPFYVFLERPDGFFSPFGYPAHLRYLNITHHAPAEVFAIGPEQWMAFPAHSKNNKSGVHGYAVRLER